MGSGSTTTDFGNGKKGRHIVPYSLFYFECVSVDAHIMQLVSVRIAQKPHGEEVAYFSSSFLASRVLGKSWRF
jgi:hypothetical protein